MASTYKLVVVIVLGLGAGLALTNWLPSQPLTPTTLAAAASDTGTPAYNELFSAAPTLTPPCQGAGCYNPCLNTYRRCQRKNGRYNKRCRAAFARCWKDCNDAVGYDNPMPAP